MQNLSCSPSIPEPKPSCLTHRTEGIGRVSSVLLRIFSGHFCFLYGETNDYFFFFSMGLLNTTYIYWKTFTNHLFLSVTPLKPLPTPYFRVLIYFRGSIYFWYLFFLRGGGRARAARAPQHLARRHQTTRGFFSCICPAGVRRRWGRGSCDSIPRSRNKCP